MRNIDASRELLRAGGLCGEDTQVAREAACVSPLAPPAAAGSALPTHCESLRACATACSSSMAPASGAGEGPEGAAAADSDADGAAAEDPGTKQAWDEGDKLRNASVFAGGDGEKLRKAVCD